MKKVIVIGAGISGLSAAVYARRSGFEVTVCEKHSMAGGLCTSWRRKGYLFEGAVHWLTGSSPQSTVNKLWRETGALNDQVPVSLQDPFSAVEWEGQTINLYRDINKAAEHLLAVSPADKKHIRQLARDVAAMSRFQKPVRDIKGLKAQNPGRGGFSYLLTMLSLIPLLMRLSKISTQDYADKFRHPALKRLFHFVPGEYSAVAMMFTLALFNTGDGGYPEGGSLALVERMVKTFESLGGTLLLNAKIKKVKIENGSVSGVELSDGNALAADAVIVTQDAVAAYGQLFDSPPQDEWLKELSRNTKPQSCTFIGVGIRAEIPQAPLVLWQLDAPMPFAGKTIAEISFYHYAGFKGYAPEGGCVLTCMLLDDAYDFWKKSKEDGRYDEEKRALAAQISGIICRKYPQAQGNIEVIDIATPLTYERYTGTYRGSWMDKFLAKDKIVNYPGFSKYVGGLYFAGQRIHIPGGLPTTLDTGRQAAQMVCRQFGAVFKGD